MYLQTPSVDIFGNAPNGNLDEQVLSFLEGYLEELWNIHAVERKRFEIKDVPDAKFHDGVALPAIHSSSIETYPVKLENIKKHALKVIKVENALLFGVDASKHKILQGMRPRVRLQFTKNPSEVEVSVREVINSTATPTYNEAKEMYDNNIVLMEKV